MKKSQKKIMLFVTAGLFVLTGTYNALVINSDSHISGSDVKSSKRLDEVYGVVKHGRSIAVESKWQKVSAVEPAPHKVSAVEVKTVAPALTPDLIEPEASVQEELSLSLVEVTHPTKWKEGLKENQFRGMLSTNNGVIEELSVSLPDGQGVTTSFAEMTGNVFEYELGGEVQSGLMYQVNQNAYMVTLTSGPLEGTRLRFSSVSVEEELVKTQETLAENNIQTGSFGSVPAPVEKL